MQTCEESALTVVSWRDVW